MGLSVYTYYETFKPHFSFRFKVDFLSNPSLYRLVQDIKLPSISINASDGRKRFGQTQFVLPFFEFGDQELEITFIETDTMKVLDYLTNNYNWPNLPNTEDIIVTEYDDTLRNVIKRTKYTITLFSYNAPQWQNSGSPSNMTITATYIVRSSRDITKDEYDLYNLPIYSPNVDINQDMNVIGSSVDEGSAESEWQKFLGSLRDEETELEKNAEFNRKRREAMIEATMKSFETNTKAKEKEKIYNQKKQKYEDTMAEYLTNLFNLSSNETKSKRENNAFKRYCNQQMFGEHRDFSMMTSEEKADMRKKFDNLSQTEKMMLMYEPELNDDNKRSSLIYAAIENTLVANGISNEDYEEAFNNKLDLLKTTLVELADANKEYEYAKNHPEKGKDNKSNKEKPLQKYTSSNSNRDADLAELRSRMQAAGVDTTNTSQVVDYLVKDGLITTKYKKDQNGLCATGTNLVAAVTSGATQIKSTGNGKDQNLSCYGYKKVASGKGADQLNDMLKHGQLKEGDVINISYADGSAYGHAVTVYRDNNGKLAFASDYIQKSVHGQSNANRVGEFYIQRKA